MLYFHLDTMMLEVYRGASEVAIYQAAYRLFGFGTTVLGMIVFPFFPFLSRLHGTDRIAFRRMLGRALFAVALFAVPPATAGAILAPGTVEGFYGDGYAASAAPLRFLMGSLVAVGAGIVGSTALIAAERQKTWLAIAAVGLLANAVANALVLPRFGAAGAAATTLGTEAWVAVAAFAAIARRDGPVIRVEDIVRVAAVAAVVAAGAFLLRDRSIWMAGAVLGPVFLLLAALVSRGLRPGRDRG
jgi:O-antigen/teichoic acid export membrane protein